MLLLHTCAHYIPLSCFFFRSWSCSKIHRVLQDCPVHYKLDARLYSDSSLIDQMANKSLEIMSSINGKGETRWNYVAGLLLNSPGLYGHNYIRAKNIFTKISENLSISREHVAIIVWMEKCIFLEQLIQMEKIDKHFLHRHF